MNFRDEETRSNISVGRALPKVEDSRRLISGAKSGLHRVAWGSSAEQ